MFDAAARRGVVESLIQQWQVKLRLQDWTVRFLEEEPEPANGCASAADNHYWTKKRLSVIRISSKVADAQLEREVVHELLHIVVDAPSNEWEAIAPDYVPAAVCKIADQQVHTATEWAIETLVVALTGTPYAAPDSETDIYKRAFPGGA